MANTVFLLLICALLIFYTNSETCEEAVIKYYSTVISVTCTNNTEKIPIYNKTVNELNCLECNITILDNTTIPIKFSGELFNLSNSHIEIIKKSTFINFTNATRRFIFENNEIVYIEPKLFSNFNSISEIRLKNNKLFFLESKTFDETKTSILDLSQNYLSNISLIFDGLKVTKLNLSRNNIKNLADSVFRQVTFQKSPQWGLSEQELDLSNNLLEKIIPNTFNSNDENNKLGYLHLQKNSITTIENNAFVALKSLLVLHLEENKISTLFSNSFNGLTNIQVLILRKNLITDIPMGLFRNLRILDSLDLSENYIQSLKTTTFSGLTSLTTLNISHNNLKILHDVYLFPIGQLYSLDISHNKLHDFNLEKILDQHLQLKILVLYDNFWNCTELFKMYKLIIRRGEKFNYPVRHFNVPNLHGIACSLLKLKSYDLSFEEFLGIIISQYQTFEDSFDYLSLNNLKFEMPQIADVIKNIESITSMFIVITCVALILVIHCTVKSILYLRNQSILQNYAVCFENK